MLFHVLALAFVHVYPDQRTLFLAFPDTLVALFIVVHWVPVPPPSPSPLAVSRYGGPTSSSLASGEWRMSLPLADFKAPRSWGSGSSGWLADTVLPSVVRQCRTNRSAAFLQLLFPHSKPRFYPLPATLTEQVSNCFPGRVRRLLNVKRVRKPKALLLPSSAPLVRACAMQPMST